MPLFETPLWIGDDDLQSPRGGICARGWAAIAGPTPDPTRPSEVEAHRSAMRRRYARYFTSHHFRYGVEWIEPQLLIEAASLDRAEAAYNVINACCCVLDGSVISDDDTCEIFPVGVVGEFDGGVVPSSEVRTMISKAALLGIELAAKASRKTALQYAIFKLLLSLRTWSADFEAFHPKWNPKEFGVHRDRLAHVTFSTAIVLAYSAIEELQLEPRPKDGKPIKQGHTWRPEARSDLDGRLSKAGISIDEPVIWIYRGTPTRVHKSVRAARGVKASWAKGPVRDEEVELGDALLFASWIRSKCSAHKLSTSASSLTPYDVFDVQNLSRRLILKSAGLWNRL